MRQVWKALLTSTKPISAKQFRASQTAVFYFQDSLQNKCSLAQWEHAALKAFVEAK